MSAPLELEFIEAACLSCRFVVPHVVLAWARDRTVRHEPNASKVVDEADQRVRCSRCEFEWTKRELRVQVVLA